MGVHFMVFNLDRREYVEPLELGFSSKVSAISIGGSWNNALLGHLLHPVNGKWNGCRVYLSTDCSEDLTNPKSKHHQLLKDCGVVAELEQLKTSGFLRVPLSYVEDMEDLVGFYETHGEYCETVGVKPWTNITSSLQEVAKDIIATYPLS